MVRYHRTRRADDQYKITPDVVYGHKAGMALTFDVIQPKKPNGAGVLFMMSGGWVSGVGAAGRLRQPEQRRDGFKHFRDLVETATRCSSSATAARRSSRCPKPWPTFAEPCDTSACTPRSTTSIRTASASAAAARAGIFR